VNKKKMPSTRVFVWNHRKLTVVSLKLAVDS
jgi:hypothetical protein